MIEVLLALIGLGILVREVEAEVQDDRRVRSSRSTAEQSWFPLFGEDDGRAR